MSTTIYQLPVNDNRSSVIELGDGGRRYRKQLVKFGAWVNPNNPGEKMVLDRTWASTLIQNFKAKVINKVPIVEGHPKDSAGLLAATRGWLHSLSIEDDGVYGELEISAPATAESIDNGQFDDVSVSFHPNYLDKLTAKLMGPALMHVGIVNDPYLKGMQPFQALSDGANVIMLSESKEYEVSNVTIKNEREFPVTVKYDVDGVEQTVTIEPGKEAEVPETVAETVKTQVTEAVKPETAEEKTTREEAEAKAVADKEAADKVAADEKAAADAAAAEKAKADLSENERLKLELSEANDKLASQAADKTYDTLLHEGKIIPAQKESFMQLSTAAANAGTINLADGSTKSFSDVFAEFLKAAPKRVNFGEAGSAGDETVKTPFEQLEAGEQEATLKQGITAEQYNKINSPKE